MAEKVVLFNGVNAIGQQVIPKPWLPMSILTIGSYVFCGFAPDPAYQPVDRDQSPSIDRQRYQNGALPWRTQIHQVSSGMQLHRTEQAEIDHYCASFHGLAILGQRAAALQGFCLLSNQYQDRHS